MDVTLTDTTTPSKSGPRSKCHEGVLYTPPNLENWSLTIKCSSVSYPRHLLFVGWRSYPSAGNTVSVL